MPKISTLSPASGANATDLIPVTQGSVTKKVTVQQIADQFGGTYLPKSGGTMTGALTAPILLAGTAQAGSSGTVMSLAPSTYGSFWTAAVAAFMGNNPSAKPQVSGFSTPSRVATYSGRDSVALYASNQDRAPLITLSSPTYDATHIFPATALSPSQVASIRIGVFIETNDSPKYTGTVTAVASDGTSITVGGGWFQTGNTGAGQIPSGNTAYVDVVTSPFAANYVVAYNGSYSQNGIGPTCVEYDIQQLTPFAIGNVFTTVGDSPISNCVQVVSQGTGMQTAGSALAISGNFARGLLIKSLASGAAGGYIYGPTSGTGFLSGQISGNAFEIRNPTSGGTTAALKAPGDLNLGLQTGGIAGSTPHVNFFSSANTNADATIQTEGGNATAHNGVLRFISQRTQVYGSDGTSGDFLDFTGNNTSGTSSVVAAGSTSANSGLSLKSKGISNIAVMGNTSGFDATIATFTPPTVSGANQTNYVAVTSSLTGVSPSIAAVGVDANAALQLDGKGTKGVLFASSNGSAAPTASDVPTSHAVVWKNTTDLSVKLYYNDGGALKSVALA